MFKNYKSCTLCGSKKLLKLKNSESEKSFYVDVIISDLKLSKETLNKIKLFQCQKCKSKLHSPWFTEEVSRKIYTSIYGQHHRSWENLLKFIYKDQLPNHGDLFKFLKKKLKVSNYAEYNSPFMGLFLNFFDNEHNKKVNSYKIVHSNLIKYLKSRQLAGKKKISINRQNLISQTYFNKIKENKKILKKKITNKFLFIDNSSLGWGHNDNYQSVNSKTYSQELFDLKLLGFDKKLKKNTFDLFGIFHSLDHTFEPLKILNFALNCSKFTLVFCHNQKNGVTKQHQFSINTGFLDYLKKKGIYNIDITNLINKNYTSPEIYFICTKSKINFESLKKIINK